MRIGTRNVEKGITTLAHNNDFMIDEDNGNLYFNEINTIPGSLAFYLWEPVGVPYAELLDKMIQLALRREREEESIRAVQKLFDF